MTIKLKTVPTKKKQAAATETSLSIAEQTRAFLDSGGRIELIKSGVSGQLGIMGSKHITISNKPKSND